MRTHLQLERLDDRDLPSVTLDQPADAFSFVLINELRRDPAGFADKLDGLRKGTVDSAFGFTKGDPVVADLRRLIQYSSWPSHYGQAMRLLRSSPPAGPLGWDDILADRASRHNDWMRTHSFEHTGDDFPNKTYIPGFNTGYRGGAADSWGYEPGRYDWWAEDIGYTYGLLAASKAAYLSGRFGRIGFQERAAFIDTVSYVLEVNSPDLGHLHQLIAPDGAQINQQQYDAIGIDLDYYEGPFETRDGLGEATISTHRFGLYRPGGSGGFLSGTAFRDGNGNAFYDAGEGMSVTIAVNGPVSFSETLDRLNTQGVFSRYLPNGTYTVSATSTADGSNLGSRTVTINNHNAWFEFRAAGPFSGVTKTSVTAPVGTSGVRPAVTWTPVPDAIGYEVRLTNLTTGRASVYPGATTAANAWTPPTDLIPGHSYRVVVRSLLPYQDGEWSPTWDFAVGTPRPSGPGMNAPTLRPAISWTGLPGATAYEVRLDDLTTGQVNLFTGQRTTGTAWSPPRDLVSGRTYVIRIRAVNSLNLGLWGPAATFSIAVPTLSGPAGDVGTLTPLFTWSAINGTNHYVVAIDDLTAGQRIYTTSVAATSWQPPSGLVNGHVYRWRVAALNAAGLGRWSLSLDFRVVA